VELVHFLNDRIETENFNCWWYNISSKSACLYSRTENLHVVLVLYTCGSTILMGRYCDMKCGGIATGTEALTFAWDLCLQRLTHYSEMSSIAKKSASVLRNCANRLSEISSDNVSGFLFTVLPCFLTPDSRYSLSAPSTFPIPCQISQTGDFPQSIMAYESSKKDNRVVCMMARAGRVMTLNLRPRLPRSCHRMLPTSQHQSILTTLMTFHCPGHHRFPSWSGHSSQKNS
jgi:hypothetical protein